MLYHKGQFTPLWITNWCKLDQPTSPFWMCMWKCSTCIIYFLKVWSFNSEFGKFEWKVSNCFKMRASFQSIWRWPTPCFKSSIHIKLGCGWKEKKHVILTSTIQLWVWKNFRKNEAWDQSKKGNYVNRSNQPDNFWWVLMQPTSNFGSKIYIDLLFRGEWTGPSSWNFWRVTQFF